uniref:Photosystem II protein Z n=1 Tax=Diplandrorchis sinica TaxID=2866081 RepID=A0A8F9W6W4_9ASPA|nr:photosystem II protein Z [Diplandrorchis sinica]
MNQFIHVKSLYFPSFCIFLQFLLSEGSNGVVHLLVVWRITKMTIAFQSAVFALIATSLILLN